MTKSQREREIRSYDISYECEHRASTCLWLEWQNVGYEHRPTARCPGRSVTRIPIRSWFRVLKSAVSPGEMEYHMISNLTTEFGPPDQVFENIGISMEQIRDPAGLEIPPSFVRRDVSTLCFSLKTPFPQPGMAALNLLCRKNISDGIR